MIKISIIVPCYKPDIIYLDDSFNSILKQTKYPYEVILAISEIDNNIKNEIYNKYNNIFQEKNIIFKIISTIKVQYPGINRNMGSSIATGDLLSFIDSDDIIHPMKLEITEYFYEKYKFDGMLHSYVFKQKKNYFENHIIDYKKENFTIYNKEEIKKIIYPTNIRDRNLELKYGSKHVIQFPTNCSFGFMTIKKEILNKIKYINFKRGEDCIFTRDCIWGDYNIMFFDLPLFIYVPQ